MKTKIDRIWDLVLSLTEDEDTAGKLDYRKGHHGEGRMTVTLDGRRVSIYIET